MAKRYLVTVTDDMARILEQDNRLDVYGNTTAEKIRALLLDTLSRKGMILSSSVIIKKPSQERKERIEYAH